MTCRVRLVLAIHDHQPIGNFDGVFEEAYVNSYAPFFDLLQEYPSLREESIRGTLEELAHADLLAVL